MQCTIVHLSERIKIQRDYSIGVLLSKAPDYISEQEYYPNLTRSMYLAQRTLLMSKFKMVRATVDSAVPNSSLSVRSACRSAGSLWVGLSSLLQEFLHCLAHERRDWCKRFLGHSCQCLGLLVREPNNSSPHGPMVFYSCLQGYGPSVLGVSPEGTTEDYGRLVT